MCTTVHALPTSSPTPVQLEDVISTVDQILVQFCSILNSGVFISDPTTTIGIVRILDITEKYIIVKH